ncbi:MAG: lytic transglycosylase domain-containing protein [Bacteriovoracaceae bacterium]|nr:lytic transglycosylase domain-containing protein [Bacteriovoracaceae bacterium]
MLFGTTIVYAAEAVIIQCPKVKFTAEKVEKSSDSKSGWRRFPNQTITLSDGTYQFTKITNNYYLVRQYFGKNGATGKDEFSAPYGTFVSNYEACKAKGRVLSPTPANVTQKAKPQPASSASPRKTAAPTSKTSATQQVQNMAQNLTTVNQKMAPNYCSTPASKNGSSAAPSSVAHNVNKCAINFPLKNNKIDQSKINLTATELDQLFESCANTIFGDLAAQKRRTSLKLAKVKSNGSAVTYQDSDRYDYEIAFWTKYWNQVFKTNPPLEPNLVKALIASESSFNVDSKAGSTGVGAMGLTQIMPETRFYLAGKCAWPKIPYLEAPCNNPPYRDISSNKARITLERHDLTINPIYRTEEWDKMSTTHKAALKQNYDVKVVNNVVRLTRRFNSEEEKNAYQYKIANRNISAGIRWLFRKFELAKISPCASQPCSKQEAYDKWISLVMKYKGFTGDLAPGKYATATRVQNELYEFAGQLEGKNNVKKH